jgi:hypothetical protein
VGNPRSTSVTMVWPIVLFHGEAEPVFKAQLDNIIAAQP